MSDLLGDTNDLGRAADGEQALVSDEAATHLRPPGFDPSRKVVINACHGGFGLSVEGVLAYAERKGLTLYPEPSEFGSIMDPTWWLVPPEDRPPAQGDAWPCFEAGRDAAVTDEVADAAGAA